MLSIPISLSPPPNAAKKYSDSWPKNEMLRKKIWLDYTILAKVSDVEMVVNAMAALSGKGELTEDMVEEVKKNSASTTKTKKSTNNRRAAQKVQLP